MNVGAPRGGGGGGEEAAPEFGWASWVGMSAGVAFGFTAAPA